jgi:hypothetical protein
MDMPAHIGPLRVRHPGRAAPHDVMILCAFALTAVDVAKADGDGDASPHVH